MIKIDIYLIIHTPFVDFKKSWQNTEKSIDKGRVNGAVITDNDNLQIPKFAALDLTMIPPGLSWETKN